MRPSLLFSLLATAFVHSPRTLEMAAQSNLLRTRSICSRGVHCILAHESTEGPFYVAHPLVRSNITEDRPGIPFSLSITVLDTRTCKPVHGVYVDIWHADAMGEYSGWASMHLTTSSLFTAFGTPIEDSRWLRGVQATDQKGLAVFQTIWPGWYQGRTTHIHLRIHDGNVTVDHGVFLGAENITHTGQLYFSDDLVQNVSKGFEPYKSHRKTLTPKLNKDDGIYVADKGGEQLISISQDSGEFFGTVTVGIDPTADHHEDHGMPGHRHPPPWGRHPPGHAKGVLWVLLGVAIIMAVFWCFRLYVRRRRAVMGYTEQEEAEQERLRLSVEESRSYGSTGT